jgi:sulfur dioxygenase
VHGRLFSLPDETAVYPAHDYAGQTMSSVGEEKRLNPRLSLEKDEFVKVMANLSLPYPRKIDVSLPANQRCGIFD